MIKFFRRIRQQLVSQNKFSKYMLYAIGEIVLVVLGILIALQINNWNEVQKQEIKIEKIYARIQSDLKMDIEEFERIIKFETSRFPYFKNIINKKLTLEDLKTCSECAIFLGGFTDMSIEKGGFNSLQNNSLLFEAQKDNSIFTEINKFYALNELEISIDIETLSNKLRDDMLYFKNNKPWYVEFKNGRLTDEIVDYMLNSWDYRNRVKSTHNTFQIYVGNLENYIDGALQLIEAIDDKVQYGQTEGWHDNGQLKWQGKWKNGERNGVHKKWYKNGQLKTEGLWTNGKQEGTHKKWFENSQLEEEQTFKNGSSNGLHTFYFDTGQISRQVNYKDGKREGVYKSWHKNGQLWLLFTLKDGKANGDYKNWYENGQLNQEGTAKDHKLDGVWKFWHEDGQLNREETYKDDEKISELINW